MLGFNMFALAIAKQVWVQLWIIYHVHFLPAPKHTYLLNAVMNPVLDSVGKSPVGIQKHIKKLWLEMLEMIPQMVV
jgi:hypothetical protein